jgi:hypothetical protein
MKCEQGRWRGFFNSESREFDYNPIISQEHQMCMKCTGSRRASPTPACVSTVLPQSEMRCDAPEEFVAWRAFVTRASNTLLSPYPVSE